ncbi:hypothetical protein Q31b_06480 [Novipirellula aureliae]|uniref:DUF6504 domain-containing protein n=2 Tax=Novipirellula aureliae TaxID=2527966 RepID=A0A5C6ED40_9BACT|nr:hypothetical protein Q31b_06480 [Novipirellula aureliae]
MPLIRANQLLSHSPEVGKEELHVLPHDRQADHQSLERLAEQIQASFCPKVAVESLGEKAWAGFPRHQAESLLCDISGVAHLFGDEQRMVAAVVKHLADAHPIPLHARLAIAPNGAAAWALAHFGKQAVEMTDDDNLVSSIETLPVESLRLETSVVETLHRLGVERIDQLLKLPRDGLATRLGKPLVNRISQILGQLDEPIIVHHPQPILSFRDELEYPTRDRDILLDRVERLIDRICEGLVQRRHGALRLRCHLSLTPQSPITMTIGLFAPSQEKKHLLSLISTRFETLSIRHDVVKIKMDVPLTAPLRHSQSELFASDVTTQASSSSLAFGGSSLSRFVDSLSGRLGRDTVWSVEATKDSLPENSYKLTIMTGNQNRANRKMRPSRTIRPAKTNTGGESKARTANHLPSHADAMRRPLTVLSQPMTLQPADGNSLNLGDVPEAFRLRGQTHRITRCWGPERIETQWWNGPSIRRDYYRVETSEGRWWWIYRDFSESKSGSQKSTWMLHGQFT